MQQTGDRSQRILVVMNNGDVYYVSAPEAEELATSLSIGEHMTEVRDTKSGALVTLNLSNISSLVKEADRG